jgi:hypothetical protein
MKNLKALQENWYRINQPTGKALGYPDCCIKEFCDQPPELLKVLTPTDNDKRRFIAGCIDGVFTGFIPCNYHAKQIISGNITLNSLIKDRDILLPPFPFA